MIAYALSRYMLWHLYSVQKSHIILLSHIVLHSFTACNFHIFSSAYTCRQYHPSAESQLTYVTGAFITPSNTVL